MLLFLGISLYVTVALVSWTHWCISFIGNVSDSALTANANMPGTVVIASQGIDAYRQIVVNQDCYSGMQQAKFTSTISLMQYLIVGLIIFEACMLIFYVYKDKKNRKEGKEEKEDNGIIFDLSKLADKIDKKGEDNEHRSEPTS